jgi:cytochrome c553
MTQRIWLLIGLVAALAAFAGLEVRAEEDAGVDPVDWSAKAKETWQHTCTKCHTAPDAGYETDRGFLAQIMETT